MYFELFHNRYHAFHNLVHFQPYNKSRLRCVVNNKSMIKKNSKSRLRGFISTVGNCFVHHGSYSIVSCLNKMYVIKYIYDC